MQKRTKIVCTIGPSCESVETLTKMIRAGMNVARLNFSHGTYENHTELFNNICTASKELNESVAILQDLQGPKIRVGVLPKEGVMLENNAEIIFDTSLTQYSGVAIPVDYQELHLFVKAGERLLLNDGKMETKIVEVSGSQIKTLVVAGGKLTSHKGINVPDSKLEVRAMSEKDREDAVFGVGLGVDFIALSFVRNAQDILDLRTLIDKTEKEKNIVTDSKIKIIAKIERREAVDNIKSILEVVDGIMVARGDLGIEIPGEQVPVIQKQLISLALQYHKPVIVATQMLDSMQENPRPTRAEVSDVANAVIDHTDAVMLSNESAVGKYPVETVDMMAKILLETENSEYGNLPLDLSKGPAASDNKNVEELAKLLAEKVGASAIILWSSNEELARLMSSIRPEFPIFVPTKNKRSLHQLSLSWGLLPVLSEAQSVDAFLFDVQSYIQKHNITGIDEVIIVGAASVDSSVLTILEVSHLG